MDLNRFEDLITCMICLEHFNVDSKCPKVLSCGHTLCLSCIEKILMKSPKCPTCKTEIQPQQVELIPVNFAIKGMITVILNRESVTFQKDSSLEQSSSPPMSLISTKLKSEGVCAEHSNYKEMRCMDCESWICGICSSLNHKHCRTILVEEAYRELKVQLPRKIETELETKRLTGAEITGALETLKEERVILNNEIVKKEVDLLGTDELIQKFQFIQSEDVKFCENMKKVAISGKNSANDTEFSNTINEFDELKTVGKKLSIQFEEAFLRSRLLIPKTIKELQILCAKQPVYVVENEILYGKVAVVQGQIWISRFQYLEPCGKLFRFRTFLTRYCRSSEMPQKVFVKMTPAKGGNSEVDIVIETDGSSQGAKKLINHCTSLYGHTYKSLLFKSNANVSCFNFSPELPPPPPALPPAYPASQNCSTNLFGRTKLTFPPFEISQYSDIERVFYSASNSNDYPWIEGVVYALNDAGVSIAMTDHMKTSHPKIGVVVSGLQNLNQFTGQNLVIKDSGLVI